MIYICFICSVGAKEFASEALKVTSEYATQAGEILQEKVPVAIEGMK
jgi:hypothetical protein